jgi:hypothetical protein
MLIRLNNSQWLTRDFSTPDEEISAAREVEVNGRRLVQVVEPTDSQATLLFNRDNQKLTLDFTVIQRHANPALAYTHLLQALQNAVEGSADFFLGDPQENHLQVHFDHVVVESLRDSVVTGLSSRLRYRLLTGRVASVTLLPATGGPGYPYPFRSTVNGGAFLSDPATPPEAGTIDESRALSRHPMNQPQL